MRDIDIRRSLRSEMQRLHAGDPGTLILDELALCQGTARVDIAVVNGVIHGYEIKSEHDTLARLSGQADVYSRALDFVTIVTGATYAARIAPLIPAWWGIYRAETIDGEVRLNPVREARDNPQQDAFAVAQLLWRDEALAILEEHSLADGVRSKPRRVLWQRLAKDLTPDVLGSAVRDRLKRRERWRGSTPPSCAPNP